MKTMYYLLPALLNIILFSCSGNVDSEIGKLDAPSGLSAIQEGNDAAVLSWTNGKGNIEGLYVFCKRDSDSYYVEPTASLPAGTTTYRFTGLKDGCCLTWVLLTLDVGYLITAAPAKRSCCSLPLKWGISLQPPLLTLKVEQLLSALLRPHSI